MVVYMLCSECGCEGHCAYDCHEAEEIEAALTDADTAEVSS